MPTEPIEITTSNFEDCPVCGAGGVQRGSIRMSDELRREYERGIAAQKCREKAVLDHWDAVYPEDVFPEDGTSVDAKAGSFARHVIKCIRVDLGLERDARLDRDETMGWTDYLREVDKSDSDDPPLTRDEEI